MTALPIPKLPEGRHADTFVPELLGAVASVGTRVRQPLLAT